MVASCQLILSMAVTRRNGVAKAEGIVDNAYSLLFPMSHLRPPYAAALVPVSSLSSPPGHECTEVAGGMCRYRGCCATLLPRHKACVATQLKE